MQHKCTVTVIDKKLYPELQAQYCADRNSGMCPCYNVGDEFVFERYGAADDFWHIGLGTLRRTAGGQFPQCSEAWDAISRYIYTALQGGSIMHGWMADDRDMIACCSDGTRPVIFRIRRNDYKVLYIDGLAGEDCMRSVRERLLQVPDVTEVAFRPEFTEVFVDRDVDDEALKAAVAECGTCRVTRID